VDAVQRELASRVSLLASLSQRQPRWRGAQHVEQGHVSLALSAEPTLDSACSLAHSSSSSLAPPRSKDSFKVGSRTVVVADCDLRGDITIGSGAPASSTVCQRVAVPSPS